MSINTGTESQFEETTIDRLKGLGYRYQYGGEVERPNTQTVVLAGPLRDYLQRRYRHLPGPAIEQAIEQISHPAGLTTERRNMAFQELWRSGLILNYTENDQPKSEHLYLADFERAELNDFLVVNQLKIHGRGGNDRIPDLLIYINGLPLVLFELKNPWHPKPTILEAHNQIGHYVNDIGQLFDFNGFCVVSDGNETRHGVHNAPLEWYAAWKSIDGRTIEGATAASMKMLVEGLFPKDRLLNYLRNFIVHEQRDNKNIEKKAAKYHQFFAVNLAVEQALRAMQPGADKRAGVVWHTQGSGKSLEIVFLIGILRRWPGLNPSIVVQVDRTDLDDQLYGSLVAARALLGAVSQAESVDDLRTKLQTEGGEVICTTIEKFALKSGEQQHPLLSGRHNILVVADEAHRTQYGFSTELKRREDGGFYTSQGHALNMRQALPNAAYLGFTGTPIDREDANTVQIFGEHIHTYDMRQAREDGAVAPIYYEARHIPLNLTERQLDDKVDALAEESEIDATTLELAKAKWSAIEQAAGVKERLVVLARDLLDHFTSRQQTLNGKAMIVCMSRRNAVSLYEALTQHADCPPVKVVMTGNLGEDPPAWSQAGHLTTKAARDEIKSHFVDPDDPLKLVIVCDMWLTGFDAPCVNTLYVDKLMRGHNLMQAIARVNRIFRDKPGGLIVDYIGIDEQLKEATAKYTQGGGRGSLTGDLEQEAAALFLRQLEITRANMPGLKGTEFPANAYAAWRSLSNIQLEDLSRYVYGTLVGDPQHRDDFLNEEFKLSKAFSLVKHLAVAQQHTEEVGFYQLVRQQLRKIDAATSHKTRQLERAVRDLLDESIAAREAIDIYAVAGLDKPDVSVLDEQFLIGHEGDARKEDLQVRLLARLLSDEIERRERKNLVRYRSYREMLEEALQKYNNRTVTAQEVIAVMRQIRAKDRAEAERQQALGLNEEEMAFYDVIVLGEAIELHQTDAWIADLVRQVVKSVRENLEVDWTKPHRSNIEAAVQSAVSRVLLKNKIKGEQFHFLRARLMAQAKATYSRWPEVA
ncbi:MAG: type I restriction endonuclease subunit R [Anaerolineae bacterium]|nr:type I restriction endonuclease subunit R [Anaerolineales bacterium]MCQ3976599.1 type I restriction endonuclease subunit R [Anaerolineae bacterium]